MALLLGFSSGFELALRRSVPLLEGQRVLLDPDELEAGARRLHDNDSRWVSQLATPVHLVVGRVDARRRSSSVVNHVWRAGAESIPAIEIGRDLYCCAPEVLLLQAAASLSLEELVFLGCDLFGIGGEDELGTFSREPLGNTARFSSYLSEAGRVAGIETARKAAELMLDRSRSPMETALALMLTFPKRLGGYGLSKPVLNETIELGKNAARSYGFHEITPDLLWKDAALAVEYNSDRYHTGAERITRDARRATTLGAEGYTVLTVTNGQLKNVLEMDQVARKIARATGASMRFRNRANWRSRVGLQARMRRLAMNVGTLHKRVV